MVEPSHSRLQSPKHEKMVAWMVVVVRKVRRKGGIWDMFKIRDDKI